MLFQKILLLFIASTLKIQGKKTCHEHCGNYVNLTHSTGELEIERKEIKVKIKEFPEFVKIFVLERKRYRIVIEKNWGDKPITRENKHITPDRLESLKWYNEKKCYIGTVCEPNGNCWAEGANACWEEKYENAVTERSFQFENAQWSTSFHYACTQDYSCRIYEKMVQLNFDNEFKPMFSVGDLQIHTIEKGIGFNKTNSFAILHEGIGKIGATGNTANCVHKKIHSIL